jgi:O-antigen/teichoic acid export membrane protein
VSLRRQFFRGTAAVALGQGLAQGLSFARNVILAWFLSRADFGVAATFAITLSLLDMLSDLSADVLLVQAPDGDSPRLQATAQFLQAVRCAAQAALILLLSQPVASLFKVPSAAWAFRCLALAPLVRGFIHLDNRRVRRDMRYVPGVLVEVGGQLIPTLAAWPLAAAFHDYRAAVWLMLVQVVSATVVSHLVAERAYRWAWDRALAARIMRFSWPLLVNGLLLFAIMQGDRVLVGAFPAYTPADLGVYSVAFLLVATPTITLTRVVSVMLLPLLSRAQDEPARFLRRYELCTQTVSLVALVVMIPFIVAGGELVTLIYGPKYAGAGAFIGWFAAMQGVRLLRVAPTLAAMSKADTVNSMVTNLVRVTMLIPAIVAAALGEPLAWIAAAGFVGEVLAFAAAVRRLVRRQGVPVGLCLRPVAVVGVGAGAAAAFAWGGVIPAGVWGAAAVVLALYVGSTGLLLLAFPTLRGEVRGFWVAARAVLTPAQSR